jgi:anthranilate synthase component 1
MTSSTLAEVRALAEGHDLVPLYETYVDDTQTPVSAFLKLRAAYGTDPAQPSFLLESGEQGRVGRFSFIGVRPRKVLRWSLGEDGDPYALAQAELARHRAPADVPGLELPFTGGAVGFFAYDLVRTVEPLGAPNPDPLGLPDLALMFTDSLVVFDHLRHTVTVLSNVETGARLEESYAEAVGRIAEIRALLAGPLPRAEPLRGSREFSELSSNMSQEQFESMVRRIITYIYAGDAFQVVPSQRWSGEVPVEAFSIYRGLRAVNPSPYMTCMGWGTSSTSGTSRSPVPAPSR